ncbi:hypothetical protein TSUD_93200 [Trifolium subterraneum]|uniref:Retrotransposon gag domain-containing protein n=1 Tax=Trifolium subterraneum TaxID=3900 RepID=A0A2Z6LYE8_TRISU|nr:hypothetical protein TSUD_93200 [Trifolium subterraneum]
MKGLAKFEVIVDTTNVTCGGETKPGGKLKGGSEGKSLNETSSFQARGSFHVLLDTHPRSLSTPPRIMKLFYQDNNWQQLLLLFRSYLGSLPYWAALHSPLRRPLAQRWGQLYKLSLTGEQGTTPPSVVELLLDATVRRTSGHLLFLINSGSNTNNDDINNNNVDVVPPFTLNADGLVLMPSEKGEAVTNRAGKSATTPQLNSPRVSENAALLDALRETIRTVNEQNVRIRALEDGQRQILGYIKPSSPPRRAECSESPPARRAGTSQRRPVLERVQPQPQVQKRNRTPPREDAVARVNKRGKAVALFEQRPRSPPRRKEVLLGGMTQGSRGDDYQYRRENSPRREETLTHSLVWSDDEVYKGLLSRQIMDLELPRALQKPPQLWKYDGLTDPDIHIQNIDAILNYQAVKGGIKCRIFPTTLVEGAMAWYRSLPQRSITSWKDLYKQFTSHFTASRKHPKTEANLEAVRQGPNETLRSYIERFNKEAVQVDVTDDMKKYPMRKNLRDGTKFKEMVAIEKPATWDEILYKAQTYMQFEEETMDDAMRYPRTEDNRPPHEQGNKNGDKRHGDRRGRDKSREPRGPPSQFTNYTPLLVPREIVLAECAASNFKNAGIRFPKSTPFKPGQDKSRFCAYHKSYGHLTEDCIQLKDAIEILIHNGKLKDYVKRKENPRPEKKREDTPEDEPRASGEKNVALAV